MSEAYQILSRKRAGEELTETEIRAVVRGGTDGSWGDARLSAFLMAAAIRGLSDSETRHLTLAMLESGEQWDLASEVPGLVDKHSTGGVGDKVSLVLSPLLAACELPVVMLTGRALGHTAGTADKLESIPGLVLELDRNRCLKLLGELRLAIGIATAAIAPADRHLYRLRDQTATVESIPLITASILSKKLATGAAALVYDVKTGNGAFMTDPKEAAHLAGTLVRVSQAMGRNASALITDMNQPLGDWVGHRSEVRETLDCLEGRGPENLMQVVYALCMELVSHVGSGLTRQDLETAIASGRARETFDRWAAAQGADARWLADPDLSLAPYEHVLRADRSGVLAAVHTRRLGLLMVQAGAGRLSAADAIDEAVSLRYVTRLGQPVEAGQELARLYLRRSEDGLERAFAECFEVADSGETPPLVWQRVTSR